MRTLVIDFDGTLCHDKYWRSLDNDIANKVQTYLFSTNKEIVNDWMKGVYTSEDINKIIADNLNIEYSLLWDTFVSDCRNMKVDDHVLDTIKRLKSSYSTLLVTDNMDCFDRFTVPALNLPHYFDLIVNSYNERISKNDNDGALFRQSIDRFGATLTDSILLDNSEKSCQIFHQLGGTSHLVTKEHPLSHWLEHIAG